MSPEVTRWWWVRHAPVVGHGGAIYGDSDVACDTSDVAAFAWLAARMPAGALWLTSHLGRAKKTAAAIDGTQRPVELRDLGEQSFGAWQGRTYAELERDGDAVYHKFWHAPAHHTPPGGESFVAVIDRVSGTVRRLTQAHAGCDIVAVTHGGTIRAALALALDLEPESAFAFAIDNLSLTRIDHIPGPGGQWRVVYVNRSPA